MLKKAIVLMAYNRPDYFIQTCLSVKPQVTDEDVIIFLDGAVNTEKGESSARNAKLVERSRAIALEVFPKARIYQNSVNAGCGLQWAAMLSTVFDFLHYDEIIAIEDDLVLSSHYIGTVNKMLYKFKDDFRVGVVSAISERTKEEHDPYLDCLTTCGHLWGIGIWKSRWAMWRDDMAKWSSVFHKHKESDIQKVIDHIRSLGGKKSEGAVNDSMLYNIMLKNNQTPVSTVANCARYIGKTGAHGTEEYYDERGFSEIPLHEGPVYYNEPDGEFFKDAQKSLKEIYGFNI
jgi:hypothetical protein